MYNLLVLEYTGISYGENPVDLATYVSNSLDKPKVEKMTYGSDFMYDFLENHEEEDKKVMEQWYNDKPGGSLHSVYVVEIENIFES